MKMRLNETHSKVCIGKYLLNAFPIQNDLKQGDVLSPLIFNFALQVQEHQEGMQLNGTHMLPLYADNANLLGKNINIKKYKRSSIRG
jgi:hypothetical protein